jgi:hypothetical protein
VDDDRIDKPRQVVVVSYPFWKQKLGGNPDVVGRILMLNGAPLTVVGVCAGGFHRVDDWNGPGLLGATGDTRTAYA